MKTPNQKGISITKDIISYPNGAQAKVSNGQTIWIHYNTGDKVWFRRVSELQGFDPDAIDEVKKIETHDGVYWEIGRKLESANWFKWMWH